MRMSRNFVNSLFCLLITFRRAFASFPSTFPKCWVPGALTDVSRAGYKCMWKIYKMVSKSSSSPSASENVGGRRGTSFKEEISGFVVPWTRDESSTTSYINKKWSWQSRWRFNIFGENLNFMDFLCAIIILSVVIPRSLFAVSLRQQICLCMRWRGLQNHREEQQPILSLALEKHQLPTSTYSTFRRVVSWPLPASAMIIYICVNVHLNARAWPKSRTYSASETRMCWLEMIRHHELVMRCLAQV